jgi:hypothetical protein
MNLNREERMNLADLKKYQKMKWFVEITKIVTHGSFGELALSTNDVSQR